MAGMQFEYDEEGGTFFLFLLSFWALILIPATYYLWPRKKSTDERDKNKRQCFCGPCENKKRILKAAEPWSEAKDRGIKSALVIGWIIFAILAYKASKVQMDHVEYDPYVELEIDRGASSREIKKQFRLLSLKWHPDKETGDQKKFMRIKKAYDALTNEEARKNWEEHGNPDGPGVTRFGIALPKWIVERENSVWVLAVYGLLFMVILPVVVGVWWYRSIKFSGDQVLLDTTKLYYCFFHKTPNMILKRVITVLAGSFEFDKFHNSEISSRPSDNEEIPALMKYLPNLNEKNKERPFCSPYSVKARALILAHCQRLQLPPNSLEQDKQYILNKCPYLINEMIQIVASIVAGAAAGKWPHMPRLETIENCMKCSQQIMQALEEKSSPLLQLPHISQDMLKHFVTKRRNIRTIQQFVSMPDEERRLLLRSVSDEEYINVMNVCAALPHVEMICTSEVLDDEDNTITAGSIVTVSVNLERKRLEDVFGLEIFCDKEIDEIADEKEERDEENESQIVKDSPHHKPKVWEKKKNKKKANKPKRKQKQAYDWKAAAANQKSAAVPNQRDEKKLSQDDTEKNDKLVKRGNEENDNDGTESEEEAENESESDEDVKDTGKKVSNHVVKDDEDDWPEVHDEVKKENQLETKAKESHIVHCPYFPSEKQECWWLYVADRKHHMLITAPVYICSLKTVEEVKLKFSAPPRVGVYQYSVILRSDSYLDFDLVHNMKLDVKEAKLVDHHPQWDISDDEDKDKEDEETDDSEYSTDDEGSDY